MKMIAFSLGAHRIQRCRFTCYFLTWKLLYLNFNLIEIIVQFKMNQHWTDDKLLHRPVLTKLNEAILPF